MSCFKLLAIRPLQRCHKRFLRNLQAGQLYPFYQSYEFLNAEGKPIRRADDVVLIGNQPTVMPDLYDLKEKDHQLAVSISAVAGKNGAGKSSLMELFFAMIYAFSVDHLILKPNRQTLDNEPVRLDKLVEELNEEEEQLRNEKDALRQELEAIRLLTDQKFKDLKDRIVSNSAKEEELRKKEASIAARRKAIPKQRKQIDDFCADLRAECYFQLDNAYFRLTINADRYQPASLLSLVGSKEGWAKPDYTSGVGQNFEIDPLDLARHFFYSITVNYSHYGLNAIVLGDWINALFHKNDGYTTPLVLNPMRRDGNFDINDEINFAKQRLLMNVMRQQHDPDQPDKERIYATDNQYIARFSFTINWPKIARIPQRLKISRRRFIGSKSDVDLFYDFMHGYFPDLDMAWMMDTEFPLKEILANYIVDKIRKISQRYPGYETGYRSKGNSSTNQQFLQQLRDDRSHVTFKLNQAVSYFRFCLDAKPGAKLFLSSSQVNAQTKVHAEFTPTQLRDWMRNPDYEDIPRRLPPSIFELDFELVNKDNEKQISYFSQLSSGEQQLIHTFQGIFYHLNNLQSAHRSTADRPRYHAINIIFDEIELYFHPEYQRKFVSEFLSSFRRYRVGERSSIRSVNIILLTHSPFILSDIPSENILLLEPDRWGRSQPAESKVETFAANINDLLANGFFLKSTLMGKFAEEKILEVIRRSREGKLPTDEDRSIFGLIGDRFLQTNLNQLLEQQDDQDQI